MVTRKRSIGLADEAIISKIYLVRNKKVMLDTDLAELYRVQTRRLNEQVKRNKNRFPDDFMFQLKKKEWASLMSQIAISNEKGGRRTLPYVFTEQGVAMLSSVLGSDVAIAVNIQIIRIFTKMREMLTTHQEILTRLDKLERTVATDNEDIAEIFEVLKGLISPQVAPRKRIGYKSDTLL